MEFTINVKVDCTDRIATFLQYIMQSATVTAPQSNAVSVNAENVIEAVKEQPEEVNVPTKKEEPTEKKPVKPVISAEITDEMLRAAIRDCKTRLLGEDVNADKNKKNLVISKLKAYMETIGVETSRDIPQEKRMEFIEYCRNLTIDDDSEAPF